MTRHALLALLMTTLASACGASSSDAPPPEPSSVATPPAAAPVEEPAAKRERLDMTFMSEALGVEKPLIVFLPPGYATSGKRYPVITMLHGVGGWQENWANIGIAEVADSLSLEAILVLPDGDDSFYVNWQATVDYEACLKTPRPFGKEPDMKTYCVKHGRYGDYITKDLIAFVDTTFRTIATRDGRAIGGLSMGGYGALVTAFRRPDLFSAVASHAGVASLRYVGPDPFVPGKAQLLEDPKVLIKGVPRFGPHFGRVFGDNIEGWKALDPASLASGLKDGQLAIYLDAGTKDFFRLHNGAQHLGEVLTAAGITHELHIIEGGKHDRSFWSDRIDDSLKFFASKLEPAH